MSEVVGPAEANRRGDRMPIPSRWWADARGSSRPRQNPHRHRCDWLGFELCLLQTRRVNRATPKNPVLKTLKLWRNQTPPKGPPVVYFGRFVRYPRAGLKAWIAAQPKGGDAANAPVNFDNAKQQNAAG